jgi:hypothetical protein
MSAFWQEMSSFITQKIALDPLSQSGGFQASSLWPFLFQY